MNRVKLTERQKEIESLQNELNAPGQEIINSLIESSPISEEQSYRWADKQIINKAAKNRLAKIGYKERDLRKDMADFYRLTGGKLRHINIISNGGTRANAANIGSVENNEVRIDSDFNKTILWHEMAHHLEADPAATYAANGFLIKRRECDQKYTLQSLTGSRFYDRNEVAYKDEFVDAYIGKVYRDEVTEVMSCGFQYLAKPDKLMQFIEKDPEMFALISGYARSSLTPAVKALQSLQDYASGLNQEKRDSVEKEFEDAMIRWPIQSIS